MGTDREQYNEDLKGLEQSWNAFVHHMYDSPSSHLHPPPALMEAVERCWLALAKTSFGVAVDQDGKEIESTAEVDPTTPIMVPAGFLTLCGAIMFEYGQRSMSFGVLVQNMLQCSCSDINDAELAALIEEGKKRGGS